jgi:tetratricopeptide (TPR) repeat protein
MLLLAWVSLAQAVGPVRSPEKLRSLTLLPPMNASLLIKSEELLHPELALRTNELAQMIVSLQQQMQQAPSDAERYALLGTYHEALKQETESAAAFSNAVSLFRVRAEVRPQDGPLQASFARALDEIGADAEAERVLRAAIRAVPEDWSCWAGLGQGLANKAQFVLFGGTNNLTADTPPTKLLSELSRRMQTPPTAAEVEEANGYLAEADKCFDRAVALGQKDFQAHLARALHRSWNTMFRQTFLRQFRGQQTGPEEMIASLTSPEACADWANAARLASTNYLIIANWGWVEALPAILSSGMNREATTPLNALPESRRRNVLEAMRRLEEFNENRAPRTAAGALEALGILRFMVSAETARAKTDFRRAVTLDPLRPQAWEGLLCLAIVDDNPDELVAVCEERLKHMDTVRNKIAAAKARIHAKQEDKALSHARAAVKQEPASALARVCLGALLLRQPLDEKTEPEVVEQFNQTLEALKAMDDDEEQQVLGIVGGVNMAIYCALNGDVERARNLLASLARKKATTDDIKKRIKEIQTVLGS